jgi:hypothetical protein
MSSSVFGARSGRIQVNASLRHALGEVGILRGGSLYHQVDPATEECFQVLLEAEVAVEERGRITPPEGDHEVQVAALYAVATADLPHLLNPVLDERNDDFTLPQTAQKEGPGRVPRPSCSLLSFPYSDSTLTTSLGWVTLMLTMVSPSAISS